MALVVAISDTHSMHDQVEVPDGDILVHAGDFTASGSMADFKEFVDWFAAQPHEHKVFTCGNHDKVCEKRLADCMAYIPRGVNFLVDDSVVLAGLKFYGSPWTPKFFNWSYMKVRGPSLDIVWDKIPQDTDVLITHGPPYGHGDMTVRNSVVGCVDLLMRVREVEPKFHIFGHIHEGYGITRSDDIYRTRFVNASTCTVKYKPTNPPLVFETW